MDEPPPTGLPSRYRVTGLLGAGAGKRVHLAEDRLLDRRIAIAELDGTRLEHSKLGEARTMARIASHPHVVPIYDLIDAGPVVYVVTPYYEGGSLAARLEEQGPLPCDRLLRIGVELCEALEVVHDAGIAHRDLKPSNVLLDEAGHAHLGDFGLASAGDSGSRVATGTPAYMAPEAIEGRSGPAADLYALGCTLYELATGVPPFRGSLDEVLQQQQLARPRTVRELRPELPGGFDDLLGTLLAKEPARRPASARDVRAALQGLQAAGAPGRPEVGVVRRQAESAAEATLVGRASELRRLDELLSSVEEGVPRVVFLRGEAGSGKSRLLRELRAHSEARGVRALVGAAPQDAILPYRPFIDALLPLAARLGELPEHPAALLRTFLQISGSPGASSAAPGSGSRHQLFAVLVKSLLDLSRARPIVLILDDLHWADAATIDLFEHLATALLQTPVGDARLMIATSLRPVPERDRLEHVVDRLSLFPHCTEIPVAGLGEDGIRALLEAMGFEETASRVVRLFREKTGGNPLFVRELIGHLLRSERLRVENGTLLGVGDPDLLPMPRSLRHAIEDRTRSLPSATRELLAVASVLGSRFELEALAALVGDTVDGVLERLDQAFAGGFLEDEGQVGRFSHPLLRQVLQEQIGTTRRQRMHLSIARWIERKPRPSPEDPIQVCHHLSQAGPLADEEELSRHAARAARLALGRFAWDVAITLIERVLASPSRLDAPTRAELHGMAGQAYLNTGDRQPCLQHLERAVECSRSAGEPALLARAISDRMHAHALLGAAAYGELPDVRPLEQALERVDREDASLRAHLMGTLAESYWFAQQPDRVVSYASAALELAERAGDHALHSESCLHLALGHLQRLDIERARTAWEAGADVARRAGDLSGLEQCLVRLPIALIASGQLDEAERVLAEARELNRSVQNRPDEALAMALRLAILVARGQIDEAEASAEDTVKAILGSKVVSAGYIGLPALACGRATAGDPGKAHHAIDVMVQAGNIEDEPRLLKAAEAMNRALVDAYQGDPFPVDAIPRLAPMPDGFDLPVLSFACAAVELCEASGDAPPDPHVRAALELAGARGISIAAGWFFFVPRLAGVAARQAGDLASAREQLTRAILLARRLGLEAEAARCGLDLARVLIESGDPDRSEAERLLRDGVERLRKHGPPLAVERAERLIPHCAPRTLSRAT